jgi:hypothetical protein
MLARKDIATCTAAEAASAAAVASLTAFSALSRRMMRLRRLIFFLPAAPRRPLNASARALFVGYACREPLKMVR